MARADHNSAIEKKRKEGYQLDLALAQAPAQPARGGNARLEQAIEADPYDETAYSVYADHLSPAALKSLKGCAKRIVSRHQREDPAANEDRGVSYRHPAICE